MNILKELYYGNVSESSRVRKAELKPIVDKELALYQKLREQLNEEQKQQFEDFIELMSNRHGNELEDTYIQGFKTGLLIAIECSKIEL